MVSHTFLPLHWTPVLDLLVVQQRLPQLLNLTILQVQRGHKDQTWKNEPSENHEMEGRGVNCSLLYLLLIGCHQWLHRFFHSLHFHIWRVKNWISASEYTAVNHGQFWAKVCLGSSDWLIHCDPWYNSIYLFRVVSLSVVNIHHYTTVLNGQGMLLRDISAPCPSSLTTS